MIPDTNVFEWEDNIGSPEGIVLEAGHLRQNDQEFRIRLLWVRWTLT
jgi:hypothetical protein